jgi:ATP-dependent protease ClpP protease subunit
LPTKTWYRIETNRGNPSIAEIYLHDEIGMWGITSKDFARDLRNIAQPVLKLHINSPGGSVDDGVAIYNALKSHGATVEVYVDALAASIASVIAMAGDKVVMAPHSRMMIHEASTLAYGFATDFEKTAARLRDTTRNIATVYMEKAGGDVDHWLGLMAEETWFTDQEAVDAGLADEVGRDVVENAFKIAANFNLTKFRNAPVFERDEAPEQVDAPEPFSADEITELRALIRARVADEAPVGDPEPSPDPREDAKAALERRLALIRLY